MDYRTSRKTRLEAPPVSPETILVTRTIHASTGEAAAVIAPDGTEWNDRTGRSMDGGEAGARRASRAMSCPASQNRWKRDALGREIETVENFKEGAAPAADVNRTTRFGYHPGGGLETLTLVNAVTGDQVTRWIYGTTLDDSAMATGHLLRTKIYPESDDASAPLGDGPDGIYERIEHTYNRQGEVVTTKDPNETLHGYLRDKMGRMRHDCVLAVGDGIDDAVKRISTEYDPKRPGLIAKVTSHDDAAPGQGNVLNEVGKAYDGFGQEIEDAQEHDGVVDGSTPKVGYGYENGSDNTARRESITYPNGRQVNLGYGAADSIEDLFSLVKSVAIQGEAGNKVEYSRVGLARFVQIAYPQPGVEMSMIRPGGGSEGDSGDPYDGYDRFSRVQEMRWQKSSGGTVLDGWQWGFNEASNRTWKKNLVAASGQDEAYGYDGVHQVIRDAVGTLNTNRTAIGGIPGEEEGFAYDPTGNWLGYVKSEEGSVILDQSRSNNKDNQLTQIDGSSALLAYDRAGNALKVPPGVGDDWDRCFQPVWDAWNRIVEVKDENGDTVQKNAYDGFFRRITKESGGVVTNTYWSDRWKPLEERLDSASTAAQQYLWGERPGHRDELVLRDRDTDGNGTLDERLYPTMDYFNGTAIMDDEGVVQERYAYSAFGVRHVMAGDFTARSSSDFDWDFGFQGQFRDSETGWYNYGYRFYVPLIGRWINRDPIVEKGGVNLYLFVGNSPISDIDLLGLECSPGDTDISNLQLTINTPSGPVNGLNSLQELLGDKATDAGLETIEDFFGSVGDILKTIKDGLGRANMTSLRMAPTAIESVHFTADVKCCRCDDDSKAYWDTTEASGEAAPDGNLNLKPTVNEFVSLVNQAFDMLTRDIARQKEQCKD